jgi:glycosyltransferase involved in cell wall biosynthesis
VIVTHLTTAMSPSAGGPFVSIRRLAQSLHEYGAAIEILGVSGDDIEKHLALWYPLVPQLSKCRFLRSFGFAPCLQGALEKTDPDIVHSHGLWVYPSIVGYRWAQKSGKPLIISPRGMLEPWARRHHWWKKWPVWWAWEKKNLESASVLHATAEEEAENLRAFGLKNPIAIIPNGVDVPECKEPVRENVTRTVLFISRIHPIKGLLNLVKAWAIIRPKDWRVIVAGPSQGGHEAEIIAAVREAGIEDQFEFPGPVYEEAKWELYRKADIFVLPSFSENFGIVVAEALASGVPVITTKGTPWHEVETNGCGWWIDIGVDPLAVALDKATRLSPEELRAMGVRGRALVEKDYTWPRIAGQILEMYKWVLGQGPKPDCVRID